MDSKRFTKALKSVRAYAPTTGIEAVYASYGARNRPVKRFKGAVLYSGISVLAILVVVVALIPRPAKAVTLDDVRSALGQARYIRSETSLVSFNGERETLIWIHLQGDGKSRTKTLTLAGEDTLLRETGFDGVHSWAINYKERKAWFKKPDYGPNQQEGKRTLVDRLLDAENRSSSSPFGVQWGTVERREDESAIYFSFVIRHRSDEGGRLRNEIKIDRETMLPTEERQFNPNSTGGWHLSSITRYEYPKYIDASVFDFDIPEGFEILTDK